jgi:hypothetical protein
MRYAVSPGTLPKGILSPALWLVQQRRGTILNIRIRFGQLVNQMGCGAIGAIISFFCIHGLLIGVFAIAPL